ncbi:hypothetical protein D6858_05155 [Tsuneonella suprasediminis]|uniref:Uncharacterized protein n=2 Tax=Tsuneonella suprasediminis TaxID=2306996 RepID=A0A419R4A1_9SPHN|nr:hypothetical protein D6858_05155 [Tsuneonella suprasediminis]
MAMLAPVAPARAAPEQLTTAQAIKRLDACLTSGAPAAPRSSLQAAVIALRTLCRSQIDRVLDHRYAEIDAAYGLPGAKLTQSQQADRTERRDAARKLLDREIAVAVSRYTQLLPN